MSQTPRIEAQKRDQLGSRYTRRLRATGQLPAVIYGHKQDPVHVSLDAKHLGELLHAGAHLIEVAVDGNIESVLVKDVQWNHLSSVIIHADLARVDLTEDVEVEVDLHLVGDPIGLKTAGAYLDKPLTSIAIRTKANNIPESITQDISALEVGQSLHAGDLKLPDGVSIAGDVEAVVAHVILGKDDAASDDDATNAEPEVITKAKEEKA